ncbi:S24 family peptidase [Lachnospiraceae bacterium KGMB03038]|nr:S24 family peptidase [Lachnospiraceae bacterium KGMB03038]
MLLKLCEYYECDMLKEFSQENSSGITYEELKIIKKYRSLSPYDQETVTTLLNRLHDREESRNIIEYTSTSNSLNRFIPYQHSASAGSGIYILGNEAADQLAIPIGPEYDDVDYAVRVNGDSMSPDFNDGDAALVSQRKEMNIGDVGIFVKNGEAFIKELGETELISRNPEYPNIPVMEDDNVVCLGKVIGKLQV